MTERRNRLLGNQDLLEAIIKDVPDGILLSGPDRRILVANDAALRIFGYRREDLVGQRTLILYRDHRDFERIGHYRRADGERFELSLRRRSGELFDAELILTTVKDPSGPLGFLGIVRDVTERNATAAELREARRRLSEALDAVYEGIVLFDPDERVIVANRRFAELYPIASAVLRPGITYADALGEAVRRGQFHIPPGEEERWIARRVANFRHPAEESLETRLAGDRWTLVGTRRTADGGTVTSYVDITRRKRLEEALAELTRLGARPGDDALGHIAAVLDVGRRYLGIARAVVALSEGDRLVISCAAPASGDMMPGRSFPLASTPAAPVVGSGGLFDFVNGADVPAAPAWRCATFVGAPLLIDGAPRGVVAFLDPEPRATPFQSAERRFLEVLADWVGARIARMREEEHRRRLEAELLRLATTDELTGIANRRALLEAAERAVAQASRYRRPLALALADLDHFKSVNDTYGHPVGDVALRLFADTVSAELRTADLFGRMGGEEFCLLLPETDRSGGLALLERICASLRRRTVPVEGGGVRITASFGLTALDPDGTLDAMLRDADAALYEAKRGGRDRAVAR